MPDPVIIACRRSPMTRARKGALASTRIDDVAEQVLTAVLGQTEGLDPEAIEDVIVGCAVPEGEQGYNVARNIALLAGVPMGAGAVTVNRLCASSMEAIAQAGRAISCGDGRLFVAGGIESMTAVPMAGFNPSYNERLTRPGKPQAYVSMGITAENVARKYSIAREEQDRFALRSHAKALEAQRAGRFEREIVPIDANGTRVAADGGPRPDTSMEALSKLKPAFLEGGSVTAGNSSPLTDGAAMTLVASQEFAKGLGLQPLASIRSVAVAGVEPEYMGMGPVAAVPKALGRAGMNLADMDLIELNEAFAAQALAVIGELGLDESRLNVNGGAIALGHPLGMSGARIVTTLIHSMIERDVNVGLATMCVGGGQGMAMVLERI